MGYSRILIGILTLCSCFFVNISDAQIVILFQIPGSEMQIEAAKKIDDQEAVDFYKRSDNQIKNAIFKDFRENFSACSIYFFLPSDYEKVKNKELTAVTFYDNTGQKVNLPADTNYYIANISFFPKEYISVEKNGQKVLEETAESHSGQGIILRNKNYSPVNGKMRFTASKIYKRGPIFKKKERYYVFSGSEQFSSKMKKFIAQLKSPQ